MLHCLFCIFFSKGLGGSSTVLIGQYMKGEEQFVLGQGNNLLGIDLTYGHMCSILSKYLWSPLNVL